jgi:gliding motility-associated-like protein
MRKLGLLILLACTGVVRAQVTTQCLEVENILVDACSPDLKEGQNEMVRILAGPNNLTVNNIIPTWPNHSFTSWIMNAVTAQKTAELNASIQSCGFLLEPLTGIIPAGRKAILLTSWDMNTSANSFAGLTDTMYILFQNAQRGNAGHFANAGTGLRTLTINYLGCSESVTYNRALLTGGDGAFVAFDQNGTATYGNNGCTAPIVPFSMDAGPSPAPVCSGSSLALNGSIVGSYSFLQWFGGQGNFSAPSGLTTQYIPLLSESGTIWLYFRVKGACPDTLIDSVQITVNAIPTLQISQSDFALCAGSSATLTASSTGPVTWSTSQTGNSINVSAAGQYIAETSNSCGSAADTVNITLQALASVQIDQADFSICPGGSSTLTATGSGTVTWNTGQTGTSLPVSSAGEYIASVTNTCGTAADTVAVSLESIPTVQISQSDFALCVGSSATLTASSTGPVTWSTSQTGNSISVSAAGQYIAGTSNSCGSAADTVNVTLQALASVQIDQADFSICPGGSSTLTATGSGTVTWNTGQTGASLPVSAAGEYIATVTNTCGTAADTVAVSLESIPTVQISQSDFALCAGSSATLTASSTGPVTWSTLQTGNSINVSAAGQYIAGTSNSCGSAADTVNVTLQALPSVQIDQADFSICPGGSSTLTATGSGTVTWNTGQTGTSLPVSSAGEYIASVTNTCGTASDTVAVSLEALPSVSISSPTAIFCASPVVLTAQSADAVLWNGTTPGNVFTANAAGTYVAVVTNTCGSVSDTLVLVQGELPSAQIGGPGSATVCAGNAYLVTVQGNGNLVWSNGNDFSLSVPGTYFLISQTVCGSDTAYFTLSVSGPEAAFTATPNTGNIPLTVQTANQSTGGVSYLWNSGNGELSVGQAPVFVYNQPGAYVLSLLVTDANGCQDSASAPIMVQQNLEVFLPNVFTPNNDGVNDDYFAVVQGASEFRIMIFNRWGQLVFESASADLPWDGKNTHGNDAVNGVYFCVAMAKDYYGNVREFRSTVTLVR